MEREEYDYNRDREDEKLDIRNIKDDTEYYKDHDILGIPKSWGGSILGRTFGGGNKDY